MKKKSYMKKTPYINKIYDIILVTYFTKDGDKYEENSFSNIM
ncbi:MAG: hypothetical protein ACJAX4_003547 [Clostridium sp.]|jgi:hypothetical protein